MKTGLVVCCLFLSLPLVAQVAEGDKHWAARAEGHQSGHAAAGEIDQAIAAYRNAITKNPADLEARWKLLRAMRFRGAYVLTTNEQKKALYADAKKEGDAAIEVLGNALKSKGIASIQHDNESKVANAARGVSGAAEIFHWDAVNWGEWALAYGKMAAAREGAADKIRRDERVALAIDPHLDNGGPQRVLGRLYDQTPHIPFITGWASSREGVRFLRESLKQGPSKITSVFLAEAMVNDDSSSKPQAEQILHQVISSPNDRNYEVEEARAVEDAQALLHKWHD